MLNFISLLLLLLLYILVHLEHGKGAEAGTRAGTRARAGSATGVGAWTEVTGTVVREEGQQEQE